MFHPFKYQLTATLVETTIGNTTGDPSTFCTLKLNRGANEEYITFPLTLIPKELQVGQSFILNMEPKEAALQSEAEILKSLLSELIK